MVRVYEIRMLPDLNECGYDSVHTFVDIWSLLVQLLSRHLVGVRLNAKCLLDCKNFEEEGEVALRGALALEAFSDRGPDKFWVRRKMLRKLLVRGRIKQTRWRGVVRAHPELSRSKSEPSASLAITAIRGKTEKGKYTS